MLKKISLTTFIAAIVISTAGLFAQPQGPDKTKPQGPGPKWNYQESGEKSDFDWDMDDFKGHHLKARRGKNRVNLLDELTKAFEAEDREKMGHIIQQMHERREKVKARRAQRRQNMRRQFAQQGRFQPQGPCYRFSPNCCPCIQMPMPQRWQKGYGPYRGYGYGMPGPGFYRRQYRRFGPSWN